MGFHILLVMCFTLIMCYNSEVKSDAITEACPFNDFCTSAAKQVREE